MPITVALQPEGFTETISRFFDLRGDIQHLSELAGEESPLLGCVDPWGTTIFNWLQAKLLLKELDALASRVLQPEGGDMLAQLREIARACIYGPPHMFIVFYGD